MQHWIGSPPDRPDCSNAATACPLKTPRFAFDLLIGIVTLVTLAVPIAQLAAAAHIAATESRLAQRYTEVCNVEGNLCATKSGRDASQIFGRLLPGN